MLLNAYHKYSTYNSGEQLLIMTVVNITIMIFLIVLATAYLSIKNNGICIEKKVKLSIPDSLG